MENVNIYAGIVEHLKENAQISFGLDSECNAGDEEVVARIYEATFEFIKENISEQLEENDEAIFVIPERLEIRARKNDKDEIEYKITALSEFKKRLKING